MGKLRLSLGELKHLGIEYNSNENKIPVWGCISAALHSVKGRVKSVIQFSVPNEFQAGMALGLKSWMGK